MAFPARVKTWAAGNTLTASDLNTEFNIAINALGDGTKDANVAAFTCASATVSANVTAGNATVNGVLLIGTVNVAAALVPIGSIIPFYDFNAALSFNASNWVYCDGSSATVGGSSRTLPDLSGRYLVGFGTDGAGDNDSAAWDTAAVGNAGHTVDVSHTHAVAGTSNSGTTGISATHTHTHTSGSMYAKIGEETGSTGRIVISNGGDTFSGTDRWATGGIGMDTTNSSTDASSVALGGTSATANTATVSVTDGGHTHGISFTSGSGGSATQSIQPRSIRVRYIMRSA